MMKMFLDPYCPSFCCSLPLVGACIWLVLELLRDFSFSVVCTGDAFTVLQRRVFDSSSLVLVGSYR